MREGGLEGIQLLVGADLGRSRGLCGRWPIPTRAMVLVRRINQGKGLWARMGSGGGVNHKGGASGKVPFPHRFTDEHVLSCEHGSWLAWSRLEVGKLGQMGPPGVFGPS